MILLNFHDKKQTRSKDGFSKEKEMKQHQNLPCNALFLGGRAPLLTPAVWPSVSTRGSCHRGGRQTVTLIVGLFLPCAFYWSVAWTPVGGDVQQSSQVTGKTHQQSPLCTLCGKWGRRSSSFFLLLSLFVPVCTSSKVFSPLVCSPGTNGCEVHGVNCHRWQYRTNVSVQRRQKQSWGWREEVMASVVGQGVEEMAHLFPSPYHRGDDGTRWEALEQIKCNVCMCRAGRILGC